MRILGIAGYSGSGKTTLVKALLPVLTARGLDVSTVKHAHHAFDIDTPGKDSYEHRAAGARQVLISSERRWALVREHRGQPEPGLPDLLAKLDPADLVLVEGWKHGTHPKLEVHRPATGTPLLAAGDPHVVAVATDAEALPGVAVPLLPLNDIDAIADFAAAFARGERGDA
jgi:molybdopterin-guanine dinucleotide biosynthesis protein B